MTDSPIDRIEEQIAHLVRANEEMSDLLRAQGDRLDRLERRLGALLDREAERDAGSGSVLLGDERPPHW